MIYDISPPIDDSLWVWPGDPPPSRVMICDIKKGDDLTLSALHSTVHLGSHADAPNHYAADAPGIDQCDLDRYLGRCQVVHVNAERGSLVTPDDIAVPVSARRVLIATGTFPDPTDFNEDFAALSPELVDVLADQGVKLLGVDTPSVDLLSSAGCPSHKVCRHRDVAILEGLVLKDVPDGVYELIALPLKLVGFDASPVRAVLRTLD